VEQPQPSSAPAIDLDRWQQRATAEDYLARQELVRLEAKLALQKEWLAAQSRSVEGKGESEVKAEKAEAKAEKAEAKAEAKAEKAEAKAEKAEAKAEKAEAKAQTISPESSAWATDDPQSTSGRHRAPGPASGPGGIAVPDWVPGSS
jgi:peptidoglycan hydrolase CwlO-like protein